MGYLTATNAAYSAMAEEIFSFWNQAFEAFLPEPEKPQPKSWYVEPAPIKSTAASADAAWSRMLPWMRIDVAAKPGGTPLPAADDDPFSMSAWMQAPLASWMELAKPQTAMACPMAFAMMSAGIPRAVAWPTARANVAAMDACNVMVQSFQTAMKNQRSSSSHR